MSGQSERHSRRWHPSADAECPRLPARHLALIRACVADENDLAGAVDRWFSHREIDDLDHAGKELLGFLYRRLVDLAVDHPARERLMSFYRVTWHRNQMLLFRARRLLARLEELGGRAVVLKGGAMVSSAYHDDLGVRPMMDLDLLVERRHVEPAVRWALDNGWQVTNGLATDDIYIVHHAIDLELGDDGAVDLHWALLVQGRNPARDKELALSSHSARLGDLPIRVLPPTYQLFHTAAHAKPEGVRHLVDVISIIDRYGDEIDWEALNNEVIERRTIAYTLRTFGLVEQARPGTIPLGSLERLQSEPRHWSDYAFHGEEMRSRRDVVRRFAADIAGRSRGAGPTEKLRVARAMVRRYSQSSGLGLRDIYSAFVTRGGDGLDQGAKAAAWPGEPRDQ